MQQTNFTEFSDALEYRDGIWFSASESTIFYPEHGNEECMQIEDGSFWFSHRVNCIAGVMQNFPPEGMFYDIGGGNGYVAAELQRRGYDITLLEPGLEGVLNARKRGLSNVICSTLADAALKPGSIPSAGIFDVLEHIDDHAGFLRQIHASLNPGGSLYITVPAYKFLWSIEDDYAGHHRRYTLGSLSGVLNQTGFEVLYATYIFSFLPVPIFLKRTLTTLLRTRKEYSPDNVRQDHSAGSGGTARMLGMLLNRELGKIGKRRKIRFGGSCLVVARSV